MEEARANFDPANPRQIDARDQNAMEGSQINARNTQPDTAWKRVEFLE